MSLFDQLDQSSGSVSLKGQGGMPQREQFVEFIKLQAYADNYVDRQEEYRILEKGIELGFELDVGRQVLAETVQQMDWVLESVIEDAAATDLAKYAEEKKRVDKKGFMQAVAALSEASRGHIKVDEAQRRLKKTILDRGIPYREGGVLGSDWLSDIS